MENASQPWHADHRPSKTTCTTRCCPHPHQQSHRTPRRRRWSRLRRCPSRWSLRSRAARSLFCSLLYDDVALLILKVTKRHQDDVTLIAPDLFPHLAANVAQALHAIGTLHVTAAVAQHSGDLSISGQHRLTPVPSSCSRCWHVLALARLALFPPSLFFGMLRYWSEKCARCENVSKSGYAKFEPNHKYHGDSTNPKADPPFVMAYWELALTKHQQSLRANLNRQTFWPEFRVMHPSCFWRGEW